MVVARIRVLIVNYGLCNHGDDMPSSYTVTQYLTDLRAIRSNGIGDSRNFFLPSARLSSQCIRTNSKSPVLFSTQLRSQGAGMPDGGFFPQPHRPRRNAPPPVLQNPERGIVEIKPADYNHHKHSFQDEFVSFLKKNNIAYEKCIWD